MTTIRLSQGAGNSPNFCFGVEDATTGKELAFIQTDWEYPPLARAFGWNMASVQKCHYCGEAFDADTPGADEDCDENDDGHDRPDGCQHDGTDGTVDCKCGLKAGDFIASAFDWLDAHDGETTECDDYNGEEMS